MTLTRLVTVDPLQTMERAGVQAVAERIVREHSDPDRPDALSYRFEKDSHFEGDQIDLVIKGDDPILVGAVLRRLWSRGYEPTVEYTRNEYGPQIPPEDRETGSPAHRGESRSS